MKKLFLIFWVIGFMLSGCGAMRSQQIKVTLHPLPSARGGLVPQDFQNPAPLGQEVTLFWGSDLVDTIPDPETVDGWKYNRPAFMIFGVGRASSETNWHNYVRVNLPRNSCYIASGRTENAYGKGSPYYVSFCTGSNPFAARYTLVSPGSPIAEASASPVMLQNLPIMPFGQGPLNIQYTIDMQSHGLSGRPIAREITKKIWGR